MHERLFWWSMINENRTNNSILFDASQPQAKSYSASPTPIDLKFRGV